jgi:predicted RNA-binding protein with EMAP domain
MANFLTDFSWIWLLGIAAILLLSVVMAAVASRQSKKLLAIINENAAASWQQQQNLEQLRQQVEQQAQQLKRAYQDVEELRSTVIGVGQRVLSLESHLGQGMQQVAELAEQQKSMHLFDPESKIYSRAMKMVHLGSSLEEIMLECELPQAEAELLFNLHKQTK